MDLGIEKVIYLRLTSVVSGANVTNNCENY